MTLAAPVEETSVLALDGDRDGWHALIEEELERLGHRPVRLVLDLRAAGAIDAPALGTFVLALKRLQRNGGDLTLVSVHPDTRYLLELTGLDRVFEVMPSRSRRSVQPR